MRAPLLNLRISLSDTYRKHVYERPSQAFRQRILEGLADELPGRSAEEFVRSAESLIDRGYVAFPRYFESVLPEMVADFERLIGSHGVDRGIAMNGIYGEALAASPVFSRAAVDPYLTRVISYYLGKQAYLAECLGRRLEPLDYPGEYSSWQWHHDGKGKQVKIMVLLTDTAPYGQRTDYLPGTHRIFHRGVSLNSRFTREAVAGYGTPIPISGPAGTAVVFDTNGLHRGNRNLSAKRDVWIYIYTAGRHLSDVRLAPEAIDELTPAQRTLARMPT